MMLSLFHVRSFIKKLGLASPIVARLLVVHFGDAVLFSKGLRKALLLIREVP